MITYVTGRRIIIIIIHQKNKFMLLTTEDVIRLQVRQAQTSLKHLDVALFQSWKNTEQMSTRCTIKQEETQCR